MNITCPCGIVCEIGAEQYPVTMTCHECGRRLRILDTGEILDAPAPTPAPTAILAGPPAASSSQLAAGSPPMSPKDDAVVDFEWERARRRCSLIPFRGLSMTPSTTLAWSLGIILLMAGIFLAEEALFLHSRPLLAVSAGVAIAAIAAFIYIRRKAGAYGRAYREWAGYRIGFPTDIEPPAWHRYLRFVSILAMILIAIDLSTQCFGGIYWVGGRDLEITFVAVDAETGEPIPGATFEITVTRDGRFCQDCGEGFKLIADADGTARRLCKQCMCFGYSSSLPTLRNHDTFSSHTPDWLVAGSAAGFIDSERVFVGQFGKTIQRGDGDHATMRVTMPLLRRQPGP